MKKKTKNYIVTVSHYDGGASSDVVDAKDENRSINIL